MAAAQFYSPETSLEYVEGSTGTLDATELVVGVELAVEFVIAPITGVFVSLPVGSMFAACGLTRRLFTTWNGNFQLRAALTNEAIICTFVSLNMNELTNTASTVTIEATTITQVVVLLMHTRVKTQPTHDLASMQDNGGPRPPNLNTRAFDSLQ